MSSVAISSHFHFTVVIVTATICSISIYHQQYILPPIFGFLWMVMQVSEFVLITITNKQSLPHCSLTICLCAAPELSSYSTNPQGLYWESEQLWVSQLASLNSRLLVLQLVQLLSSISVSTWSRHSTQLNFAPVLSFVAERVNTQWAIWRSRLQPTVAVILHLSVLP